MVPARHQGILEQLPEPNSFHEFFASRRYSRRKFIERCGRLCFQCCEARSAALSSDGSEVLSRCTALLVLASCRACIPGQKANQFARVS
ncbi:hypothetical protein HPP92_029089 [Vanilla planifolia]|uniref:Uncharacterized protein n=1 Tax=Vanilla planifolia TaxID=51239 RepID=A0A835P4Z6_VANPL|nr:hypothetical protein HPP92_029078 [Vanilla planifolia]KAG0445948.1 hypothetical protein HPP92_029089 [Vanilla planifolia]